jgi:CRP-like cAMP-binding protein
MTTPASPSLETPSAPTTSEPSTPKNNVPHPHFLWTDLFRPSRKNDSIIEVLRGNILFQALSPLDLRYLSGLVYERIHERDEPIFRQGDRGLGMYLISKGSVAIRTQLAEPGGTPGAGGGEVHVTTLTEGGFFGELALVDPDNLRSATAIALERTVTIGFFKPDLMELLERRPAMGVQILFQLSMVLGKRLLETTERITTLSRLATPK